MSNLSHHLLAATWSFALAAALLTLLAKGWLRHRLGRMGHPMHFDTQGVYLLLLIPGVLPLVWLVSELAHLQEDDILGQACCALLALSSSTWLMHLFGLGALCLSVVQLRALRTRWNPSHTSHQLTKLDEASAKAKRVIQAHAHLRTFARHIHVVDCHAYVCAALGLVHPRIEIAASLVARLEDRALEAALLHECAHLERHDTRRAFCLFVAQVLNPFSWILAPELAAWRFAREVACDADAVSRGAWPTALAEAILSAARAATDKPVRPCMNLRGQGPSGLSMRVNLLLNGSLNALASTHSSAPNAALILLVASVGPHLTGAWLMHIHCQVEAQLHTLLTLF